MRFPFAPDGSFQLDLSALRRPSVFLHFFDVHFLEERGVEKFMNNAFAEARLATRLAVMLADEVLVPASSYIESSLCSQVINEFPPELYFDRFTFVGGGASFDEFVEEKQTQYRVDQPQGIAYRASGLGIKFPWRTRRRSATADISRDWVKALPSGSAESFFRAAHGETPQDIERRWREVPERLGGNAFIVENVAGLLFDTPVNSLITRNRLHAIVNRSYFGSYAEDLGASMMRNMIYLGSSDMVLSGNPEGDLDYRRLLSACRAQGILKDIQRARAPALMALENDPRFAAAYAIAHPPAGSVQNDASARPSRGAYSTKPNSLVDAPRVLILTALPKEAAAVLATFDDWHDAPGHKGDANVYREGSYRMPDGSKRRVLLVQLPTMGNESAAGACLNAFRTHEGVVYAIMVGIAGACPNPLRPDEHVRLGDVVVSNAKGVFDYGHVKRTAGGDEARGSHQRVSPSLLSAFDMLMSEAMVGKRPWETVLKTALAKEDNEAFFGRPNEDKDLLRRTVDGKIENIPHPPDTARRPGQPRLHGGAIGAANILLKEPGLRDHLRDEYGVRAVEMEANGMQTASWLANRHFIVVRGACDYADAFKNDDWQNYAALTAASVARCIVERMPEEWFA